MIKQFLTAAAALTMLAAPSYAQEDPVQTKGEIELAKLLDGRVAGEPRDCIRTLGSRNLQRIDETALVYRSGDTIWVNYTRMPDQIDDNDILVIKRFSGTSLCRSDQISLRDRVGGFYSGFLILDDFVPYRMPSDG